MYIIAFCILSIKLSVFFLIFSINIVFKTVSYIRQSVHRARGINYTIINYTQLNSKLQCVACGNLSRLRTVKIQAK